MLFRSNCSDTMHMCRRLTLAFSVCWISVSMTNSYEVNQPVADNIAEGNRLSETITEIFENQSISELSKVSKSLLVYSDRKARSKNRIAFEKKALL